MSIIKSIRKNRSKYLLNSFQLKTARTAAKNLRSDITKAIQKGNFEEKEYFKKKYILLISKYDKLAKKKILHKNKVSHLKSKMNSIISSFLAHSSSGRYTRFSS